MKKIIFLLMTIVLLCMGFTACGGGSSPISKYCNSLEKAREKMYKGENTNGEMISEIADQFMGQTLATELDDDVSFDIIEPFTVISVSPLYGDIEFEAIIKTDRPQDYVYIACNNSEPIIILNYDPEWNEDESCNIRFFLNVGNIIQGGEKADEKLRGINRVVITEYGSELFQRVNN